MSKRPRLDFTFKRPNPRIEPTGVYRRMKAILEAKGQSEAKGRWKWLRIALRGILQQIYRAGRRK